MFRNCFLILSLVLPLFAHAIFPAEKKSEIVTMTGKVWKDSEIVAQPTITTQLGSKAMITVGSDISSESWSLEIIVTRVGEFYRGVGYFCTQILDMDMTYLPACENQQSFEFKVSPNVPWIFSYENNPHIYEFTLHQERL